MNRYRIGFIVILLIAALFLAPYARLGLHYLIIDPVAYYWWLIKQVVGVLPQTAYWVLFAVSLATIASYSQWRDFTRRMKIRETKTSQMGPVQSLAENITWSQKSAYFKWLIAHRLATTSLEIYKQNNRENTGVHRDFSKVEWNPPPEIKHYLERGLNTSFMEYRHKRRIFKGQEKTPFDVELDQVIEFIELQMES